jgi:hypothetical protein
MDPKYQGAIPYTKIYDKDGNFKNSIVGASNYEKFEKAITDYLN